MENYPIDDNDENFLLTDDGIREKSQIPRGEILWTRKPNKKNDWNHSNIALFNEASGPVIPTILEELNENLEDSPLLINVSTTLLLFFCKAIINILKMWVILKLYFGRNVHTRNECLFIY